MQRQHIKHRHNQKGMTLVELMVAMTLFVLLTTGVYVFLHGMQTAIRSNQTQMDITNQTRLALESMVWGTEGGVETARHGIWEARSLTVVDPQTLQFQGDDGNTRTIRQNGQNIEYVAQDGTVITIFDPNGADGVDAGTYNLAVTFSQTVARVVDVKIVMQRRTVGRWLNASLSTQVAIRNT